MKGFRTVLLVLGIAMASLVFAGKPIAGKANVEHAPRQSIAASVASNPNFKTLATALAAAGLREGLDAPGSRTLFAPTEAAFAKLPPGKLDEWMKPENHDQLVAILNYHLVPMKVEAKQLARLAIVPTVNGDPLVVAGQGKQVSVDGARLIKTDIQASNGVIHAIDNVLIPDGK